KLYIKKTSYFNYVFIGLRLNIIFTVNKFCKGNAKPIDYYDYVICYLFRYLVDNLDLGLLLGG
ncbi:hypothetical protein QBC45DRAFT_291455, partial [Copromyces sp. CBS 386.78]